MTQNKKFNLLVICAVVAIGLVGYGIAQLSGPQEVENTQFSSTGSTFNTAKISEVIAAFTTSTSTAVYNSDTNDRVITDSFVYCTGLGTSKLPYTGGAGIAELVLYGATSTSATASSTNTNFAVLQTVATSSASFYVASTTATSLVSRVWASGSYFQFYTNATNTASCAVGVKYIGT